MDGFKNSTRMKTFSDEAPQAYAKGGKVGKVMGEFAAGKLHSGSKKGPEVTSRKQAIAIGISEAKKAGVAKKNNGGLMSKMSPADRRASEEQPSRPLTAAEMRAAKAVAAAKAAAPKQGPLIKPARQMTPAERRMNQMDRPTNNMGAEAYKGGGKVGGSKVPFAVKKVMRKAEGGAVTAATSEIPILYGADYDPSKPASPPPMPVMPQEPTPQSVFGAPKLAFGNSKGTSHPVMPSVPEMPNEPMMPSAPMGAGPEARPAYESMPEYIAMQKQMADLRAQDAASRAQLAAQDRAATLQAQQEMAAQAQMDRGLGRGLAPMYGRGAPPRFMR